jgi:RimJ/RimL family protein N-acetyltransferase
MQDSHNVMAAPTISTERLILRAHKYTDFDVSLVMWKDAEFYRFTSGAPLSEEEAWTKMIRHAGHWSFLGFGY